MFTLLIKEGEHKKTMKRNDQILMIKQSNPDTDVSSLEKQIDQLVYKLYGLTDEEIKIIEGGK